MSQDMTGTQSSVGEPQDWSWLGRTFWYVPAETLLAIRMTDIRKVHTSHVQDQTLWFVERYEHGYLIGRCATSIDGGDFSQRTLVGSITPDGHVALAFGAQSGGSSDLVYGSGRMVRRDGQWAFLMQMTSGSATLNLTHWSYMLRTRPGEPSWDHLPGVPGVSVGEVFGL